MYHSWQQLLLVTLTVAVTKQEQSSSDQFRALKDIWLRTGGEWWINNWDFTGQMCDQFGIDCSLDEKVTGLRLRQNNLTGSLSPGLLSALSDTLQVIDLSGNRLTGTLHSFTELPILIHLDLSDNKFTSDIPFELFRYSQSLSKVNLENNLLFGNIPVSLGLNRNLLELKLGFNRLSGGIPSLITRHFRMEILSLSHNQLTGDLPLTLSDFTQLRVLDLSHNLLTHDFTPDSLIELPLLRLLNLQNNQLSGHLSLLTPDLRLLWLDSNLLSGDLLSTVLNHSLPFLVDLRVANNHFFCLTQSEITASFTINHTDLPLSRNECVLKSNTLCVP